VIELPIRPAYNGIAAASKGFVADDYVLASRQRDKKGNSKPVCRKTAYNYMQDIAKAARLPTT
jgi:hypothetical protein